MRGRDGRRAPWRRKAAIKARRPDLPVGLSLAIVDDVVVGDDPTVRDRKRAEVYERWLELARDDDFIGVQNYERIALRRPTARCRRPRARRERRWARRSSRSRWRGAVRYAHEATGVPVLVTEHGMSTDDDTQRAAFIEPSLAGLLDVIDEGVPVLGYCHWTLMDNFEWIFGYGHQLGLHEVDRETFVRTAEAERRRVRSDRSCPRGALNESGARAMRLTHFGHACVLVETDSTRVLIDPGTLSEGYVALSDLDAVLITHQHGDHLDLDQLPLLLSANTGATLYVDTDSAPLVIERGLTPEVVVPGDSLRAGGSTIEVRGGSTSRCSATSRAARMPRTSSTTERCFTPGTCSPCQVVTSTCWHSASGPWLRLSTFHRLRQGHRPAHCCAGA